MGHSELLAAMGEIDRGGGEGGPPGVYAAWEPGPRGQPGPAAEQRAVAEDRPNARQAGEPAAEGRRQQALARAAERVADCGAARHGGDGARFLGGVAAADRRGIESRRRDV